MDLHTLEREIDIRRKRAAKLGIDLLVTRIYFEHGFRNYSLLPAAAMEAIFPSVQQVTEQERDRLDFKIEGRPYAFRVRERSYSGRDATEVELYRGNQVVFGSILRRKRNTGRYRTDKVTAFVEGSWIHDIERLDREASDYYYRKNHSDLSKTAYERAKRFGISPTSANDRGSLLRRLLRIFGV